MASSNQANTAPTPPTPLTEFHLFPRLPIELRHEIFSYLLPEPRILTLTPTKDTHRNKSNYGWVSASPKPILSQICFESVNVFKHAGYVAAFVNAAGSRRTWFNFEIDTLYLCKPSTRYSLEGAVDLDTEREIVEVESEENEDTREDSDSNDEIYSTAADIDTDSESESDSDSISALIEDARQTRALQRGGLSPFFINPALASEDISKVQNLAIDAYGILASEFLEADKPTDVQITSLKHYTQLVTSLKKITLVFQHTPERLANLEMRKYAQHPEIMASVIEDMYSEEESGYENVMIALHQQMEAPEGEYPVVTKLPVGNDEEDDNRDASTTFTIETAHMFEEEKAQLFSQIEEKVVEELERTREMIDVGKTGVILR